MSSYRINDLDNNFSTRTYSFLPNTDRDKNGENLITQSLVIQAPYRRIRHPELVPVILNRDSILIREERSNHDIMSQSLIVPPYRRVRHAELAPVQTKESSYKSYTDSKNRLYQQNQQFQHHHYVKAPKRALSMTRLDQLAKPRQRYLEEALKLRASKTKENLCSASSVRPTSSMSLARKNQSCNNTSPRSANISTNTFSSSQSSTNNGTLLLRQRTSARKQRPVSYAGYSLGSTTSNQQPDSNLDHSSTLAAIKSSTVKAKSPFGNVINRNLSSSYGNGNARNTSLMMVSSIDGSMTSSLSKPTPPRKPAHIKAASVARKLAKQQHSDHLMVHSDSMKKSESSPRISQQQLDGHRSMKKSVTNPERMVDLLSEKSDVDDKKVIKRSQKSSNIMMNNSYENDKSSDLGNFLLDEDISSNLVCQLIDLNNGGDEEVVISRNECYDVEKKQLEEQRIREEEEKRRKQEEEEEEEREKEQERRKREEEEMRREEQKKLEMEEVKRKAAEEEIKRREEKERELERRAKEKAEKARLEMEERLRKDEQERIERKKRFDAIMSRTRKNPSGINSKASSPSTENVNGQQQQIAQQKQTVLDDEHSNDSNNSTEKKQNNPDLVEDAIKSNLIKLTNNDNLNNCINNVKSDLHYIESETLIQENKNINLINGFKEMKVSTNSTFVFSQTSNESPFAPWS